MIHRKLLSSQKICSEEKNMWLNITKKLWLNITQKISDWYSTCITRAVWWYTKVKTRSLNLVCSVKGIIGRCLEPIISIVVEKILPNSKNCQFHHFVSKVGWYCLIHPLKGIKQRQYKQFIQYYWASWASWR